MRAVQRRPVSAVKRLVAVNKAVPQSLSFLGKQDLGVTLAPCRNVRMLTAYLCAYDGQRYKSASRTPLLVPKAGISSDLVTPLLRL